MSIKLQVDGHLGKDPAFQTINAQKVLVLSIASRRPGSRHADWINGTIWNEKLGQSVSQMFKKGDRVQVFGILGKLSVYWDSSGKPKPGVDMFVNSIGIPKAGKERIDVTT